MSTPPRANINTCEGKTFLRKIYAIAIYQTTFNNVALENTV
jgi:hypothetical protein